MAANHSPKATKAPALVGHKGPVICLDVNSSESLLASASEVRWQLSDLLLQDPISASN
jgi:hypothetical protein